MRAFLLSALIGLIVGVGGAQTKPKTDAPPAESKSPAKPQETTLTFPKEGERWWWTEDAQGEPLNAPQKTRDASVRIQLPASAETLWVYEADSGNLAQLKVADLAEKTEITSDRWTHVARVQVNLKAQEKPVASALVSLTDAKGNTIVRVLEPSAEGVLVFERVPLGKVEITARYGEDQKASQETTLKAERDLRVPVIELALSGTVATLEPKATAEQAAAETEQASPASRIGAIVMFIIALLLAAGVIVVLVRLALQRPQQLGEAMSKLGVELPQAATSGAGAA
ncbi:MAG: hypothetical protein NZM10_06570, partial [Fimbriimonadales bacterium]|nr:hypothetical protein [Fimbriimonadales bacterium]